MQNTKILILGLMVTSLLASCASQRGNINSSQPKLAGSKLAQPMLSSFKIPATCSAELLRPAVFREEPLKVLVYDGSASYTNIPAELSWSETKIQVEPARYAHETEAAEYETIEDVMEIERARSELYASPAKYKATLREVLVKPEHRRWQPGCLASPTKTCLEKVSAAFTQLKTEVVQAPAQISQRDIPAKKITITRKKLIKAGKGRGEILPARYETIKRYRVSKPWKIISNLVPSRYETLMVQRKLRDEQILKMPVICPNALSTEQITQIQQALIQNGQRLSISGRLDLNTLTALHAFQVEHQLLVGAITLETLRNLGLT